MLRDPHLVVGYQSVLTVRVDERMKEWTNEKRLPKAHMEFVPFLYSTETVASEYLERNSSLIDLQFVFFFDEINT